jgi:hypothetical protein
VISCLCFLKCWDYRRVPPFKALMCNISNKHLLNFHCVLYPGLEGDEPDHISMKGDLNVLRVATAPPQTRTAI